MNCPFCERTGTRPELHAHLTDGHVDKVLTRSGAGGRRFYEFHCPFCDEAHVQEIKPRLRDPGFIEEYAREIRIVAFDLLLYHVQEAHKEVIGV